MAKHNPFSSNNHDLGIDYDYGVGKSQVDDMLLNTVYSHSPTCFVCSTTGPQYRVVPKHTSDNTAEVQKGVFICRHCLTSGALDPNRYGLRELE